MRRQGQNGSVRAFSRKFCLFILVLATATGLLLANKIGDGVWATVVTAGFGIFTIGKGVEWYAQRNWTP